MANFPTSIERLIREFSKLPSVGRKTAEHFVFNLLKRGKIEIDNLSLTLENLKKNIHRCPECQNFSEKEGLCNLCNNPNRNKKIICLVEESHDLNVIESTNEFSGVYHILGGKLNPIEGITADILNFQSLLNRIKKQNIQEIIFALNPDIQGEATLIYLKKLLQPYNIKISRLARGIPMGADLEYTDEITLANALKNRTTEKSNTSIVDNNQSIN